EGRYREQTGRDQCRLVPDTMCLHPAGETHSNQFARSGARIFCIEFTADSVRRLRAHDVDFSKRLEVRGGAAIRLAHPLYQQFRRAEVVSTLSMEGLILELLSEVLFPEQTGKDSQRYPWMKTVLALVHSSYREPMPLAKTAKAAGVHPVHLARSFR